MGTCLILHILTQHQRAKRGTSPIAIIHAHGAYDVRYDNENFSGKNGDRGVAAALKVPIYVTTPGGKLKEYDPNKWFFKTATINSAMPRDPNSK